MLSMVKKQQTKEYDLSKILKDEHSGKWVAVSSDHKRVVDYSDDLVSLGKRVGTDGVVYIKTLPKNSNCVFLN